MRCDRRTTYSYISLNWISVGRSNTFVFAIHFVQSKDISLSISVSFSSSVTLSSASLSSYTSSSITVFHQFFVALFRIWLYPFFVIVLISKSTPSIVQFTSDLIVFLSRYSVPLICTPSCIDIIVQASFPHFLYTLANVDSNFSWLDVLIISTSWVSSGTVACLPQPTKKILPKRSENEIGDFFIYHI